ncbi:5-formyltetrahydrofolate cyclo-ligase [bacterium]|nr:5-formyltetrahydrofolate cyclo-ligase [bacterium]
MEKAEARREAERRIDALTAEKREDAGRRIRQRLAELREFLHARTVMMFVAMPDEVSTLGLIEDAIAAGKTVVLPHVDRATHRMDARIVRDVAKELVPGAFGILEPRDCPVADPASIEFVLVPGRAFDREGNRLGRGGGYYDRFLAPLDAVLCGCAFAAQVVDAVPCEAHDLPVGLIVTEDEVIRV